jgi:hypothetical protein
MCGTPSPDRDAREAEARLFAGYLLGRTPGSDLIARYLEADRILLASGMTARDRGVIAFARRHPWSLPFLDAAAGLLRPDSFLRRRLLVMAAILEASPECADDFLPRRTTRSALAACLLGAGTLSLIKLVGGIPLLWVAERAGV